MKARTPPDLRVVIELPSGKRRTFKVPHCVAWVVARGIALQTHIDVALYGQFGSAHFNRDGSGYFKAARPTITRMQPETFDCRTHGVACIN
jgi:hypothetical protein